MPEWNAVLEGVWLRSADRRLEGILAYRDEGSPTFAALIAGPHPLLGGDLKNNLVSAMREGIAAGGGLALSFNYSGIGGGTDWPSAMSRFFEVGTIGEEALWVQDTRAALRELANMAPIPLVGIGYSFGCHAIAACLADTSLHSLILISPNPLKHSIHIAPSSASSLLAIHSDNDFSCPAFAVQRWYDGITMKKTLQCVRKSEHFFRGQERMVVGMVMQHLRSQELSDHHEPGYATCD